MRISVCMATFNGEKYIYDQLLSILSQLKSSDEVIISDDSSTDNTLGIIESMNDRRIKLLPGQKFKSPVFNFENALKHATGDHIYLSDQDDIWMKDKIEIMEKALQKNDLVVSDCCITDAALTIIEPSLFTVNRSKSGLLHNTIKNGYLGCCMAFNRKVLNKSLPFPADTPMHDIWLGMVADAFFKVAFIPDRLVYYRRHDANSVQWKEGIASVYSLGQKLKFRFSVLRNLMLLKMRKGNLR